MLFVFIGSGSKLNGISNLAVCPWASHSVVGPGLPRLNEEAELNAI